MAEATATLGPWLDEQGGNAERLFERTLAGFFADAWTSSNGHPLGALIKNPGKYLRPPQAASQAAAKPTVQSLRKAAGEAAFALRNDEAKALHAQADELERQLEREARRGR
jgi:hypothetical protein